MPKASKLICLQGDPGTGKSQMVVKTAMNKPVYCTDVDRKMESAAWAQPFIDSGDLIVWDLDAPVDESNITGRLHSLTTALTTAGPTIRPRGVTLWAEQIYRLPKIHKERPFGTLLIDSATILNEHVKAMIQFDAKHTKLQFDEWNALKIWWMTTFSVLRDLCKENGWDLAVTVHERAKGEPGDKSTGIEVYTDVKGNQQTVIKGTQDIAMWASIDGAFGNLIGVNCDEYYHLYVDATNKDKPQWKCRVWPDGRRSLRTSFNVDRAVFNPDFKEIWK